jgi:hypothetical protein
MNFEDIHWEVLQQPAYSYGLAPSDFHLFRPLREALRGKIFTADDEVKFILCNYGWKSNYRLF